MDKKKMLISYLKERIYVLLLMALSMVILLILSGLYGYREAFRNMLYGAEILIFAAIIWYAIDFGYYRKHCRELMQCLAIQEERDKKLPESRSCYEHIYQEMISAEENEKRELSSKYDDMVLDMSDYYTMWTHQIKTPIAALKLVLQDKEGTQLEEEELFQIEQYVEMALQYARINHMSSDMRLAPVNVRNVVKQSLKKYSLLFCRSGLEFSLEEFDCEVVSDEKWLCFVVEQLLSNALKYTYEGKISIYGLNEERKKTTGHISYLVIEDTGIGIPKEDLPRIFERGFTGFNGHMDKKSTGIGLYLCKTILKKLSHSIEAESEPMKGSRFIIDFSANVTKM